MERVETRDWALVVVGQGRECLTRPSYHWYSSIINLLLDCSKTTMSHLSSASFIARLISYIQTYWRNTKLSKFLINHDICHFLLSTVYMLQSRNMLSSCQLTPWSKSFDNNFFNFRTTERLMSRNFDEDLWRWSIEIISTSWFPLFKFNMYVECYYCIIHYIYMYTKNIHIILSPASTILWTYFIKMEVDLYLWL